MRILNTARVNLSIVVTGGWLAAAIGAGAAAPKREPAERLALRPPVVESAPRIDGKLDEPCWKKAAGTGPLRGERGRPVKSATEAFICHDADYLYVGVICPANETPKSETAEKETEGKQKRRKAKAPSRTEHVELLIDSNRDGNSFYVIRISPHGRKGRVVTSYREAWPPWHDRTWQPGFERAVASGENGWAVEIALPFSIFNKNKTLASEIGFNIRRHDERSEKTYRWAGAFLSPAAAGVLKGIPARDEIPPPEEYVKPTKYCYERTKEWMSFLAEEEKKTIALGPGSMHPGTTGEARIELEEFLMTGDPHARGGFVWDIAVNEKNGELFVLSEHKFDNGMPRISVFDRRGGYLRTIMPFNPTLPRAAVKDLCRKMAREGGVDLVVPHLWETAYANLSLYGEWWHQPQKMVLAPNGDLIMSNIFRATLWRMRPDGSLPGEGWTSIYNPKRNEPFESANYIIDTLCRTGQKHYLPFSSFVYPYFCLDRKGNLYVSSGRPNARTKHFVLLWELTGNGVRAYNGPSGVWKFRMQPGVRIEPAADFRFYGDMKFEKPENFLEAGDPLRVPLGVTVDGDRMIVADGSGRLQVFDPEGRLSASIQTYEHEGKTYPLGTPLVPAVDRKKHLYVLVSQKKGRERLNRLLKLHSLQSPRLLAASEPLHQEAFQFVVDSGVTPPNVWVANGAGPGSLLQLSGDDLKAKATFADDGTTLSCPSQYGSQPILNIDPETGHVYIEDDSSYRPKKHGTVYRLDQEGKALKTWDPVYFLAGKPGRTSNWGGPDLEKHYRYPDEPLFIDSIFGKDGRVYRWKLEKSAVKILRFDRAENPIPFKATGTNVLPVDRPGSIGAWHEFYHGMDIDRYGNIYYVARGRGHALRRVDVYDADGNLEKKGLLRGLHSVRGILLDEMGNMYVLHRPEKRPWLWYMVLSKFGPLGGRPLWSRPWEGWVGQSEVYWAQCHCLSSKLHQALDGKGYLFAAGKHSILVIDRETGKLVGQFGSYGNMDCRGKGSAYPHPELPFGIISGLSVWKDRLFVVDLLNRRIAKCRIVYDSSKRNRAGPLDMLLSMMEAAVKESKPDLVGRLATVRTAEGAAAVPALIEVVKQCEGPVRLQAIAALAGMGHAAKAAVPTLLTVAGKGDRTLRQAVQSALYAVKPQNQPPGVDDAQAVCMEGRSVEIELPVKDTDDTALALKTSVTAKPAHGKLERLSPTKYRYMSEAGFVGEDTFEWVGDDSRDKSAPARGVVIVKRDTFPPEIDSARVGGAIRIILSFNEPVTKASAETAANYHVKGCTVKAAALSEDGRTLTLTVAKPLKDGAKYTIRATGVRDRAKAGNHGTTTRDVTFPETIAVFVDRDAGTRGNWSKSYGADGYHIFQSAQSYPAYAKVVSDGNRKHTWNASTPDIRALEKKPGADDRIAACRFEAKPWTIDVDLTDGQIHRVALYCLDWDKLGRSQQVDILDAETGVTLDRQTLPSFDGGIYLVWDIKGHVTIRVQKQSGLNGVVSGVFFGPAPDGLEGRKE